MFIEKEEMEALEKNGTWEITTLPEGKRALDSKWVYKIKLKPNGDIERYKARLVARGDKQIKGKDYKATFSFSSLKVCHCKSYDCIGNQKKLETTSIGY